MPSGPYDVCLACGREITEFEEPRELMGCPKAHRHHETILSLMPEFPTKEKMSQAMEILKEGGYNMSSYGGHKETKWSPIIPIIEELATRLMRHEPVNGIRFHRSGTVCKECVEKQSHCDACGHDHPPTCPVCKTELVPLVTKNGNGE